MAKHLLVFIDSLPFERLHLAKFISSLSTQVRLVPGLGYSVNLLPELFLGLSPDEVGFFGEWTYDPIHSPFKSKALGKVLQFFAQSHYYVDRLIHKALARLIHINLAQIPFDVLLYFSHRGSSVYRPPLSEKAIFSLLPSPFKLIRSEEVKSKGLGKRDNVAFSLAHNALESNLFISLVDLDGFGHKFGVGSLEHDRYIIELDHRIAALWDSFLKTNMETECILTVLSDHGMSNVKRGINLNLSALFGSPCPSSYIFFLDSTILRVWSTKSKILQDIKEYLEEFLNGHLVTAEERILLGLTAPYVGDLLYVLEEGSVFLPSFQGLRLQKGMHGYHPSVQLQHAVLACSEQLPVSSTIHSRDAFGLLRDLIKNKL